MLMGSATTVVNSEFRKILYDIAVEDPGKLWILYDRTWGDGLHYLEILSDKLKHPGQNGHVDVILDEHGLRFKQDQDV